MTRHLELEDAVDFVRGLASAATRTRVERHLAEPCERCRVAVAWAQRVTTLARQEAALDVPDHLVRRAVASFPARRTKKVAWPKRLLAKLVFDSALEPALAGVRTGKGGTRQAMYRAGAFLVDLRVDFDRGQRRVSLVGQIATQDATGVARSVFGSAQLTSNNTIVAESLVNEFGEFQFECRPQPRLRLRIPLDPGPGRIEVPLSALIESGAEPAAGK